MSVEVKTNSVCVKFHAKQNSLADTIFSLKRFNETYTPITARIGFTARIVFTARKHPFKEFIGALLLQKKNNRKHAKNKEYS